MKPEQVKTIRLARGFSQQKFADMIGATQVTVSRWGLGASPPTGATGVHRVGEKTISKRGKSDESYP